jgi:hypothetical protein
MQKIAKAAAIAAIIAGILNVVVFYVANAVTGPLVVQLPAEMTLEVVQPLIFTVMLSILGSLIVSFIAMRFANPRRLWVTLTIIGVVLYGVPPFLSADATTAIWFNVMHAVAACFVIPMVAKALPETK